MGKKKNSMIGKAVEWKMGNIGGKGIIRDRYKNEEGEPIYLLEQGDGKIKIVHSTYLTRFILFMIVVALGYFTFA